MGQRKSGDHLEHIEKCLAKARDGVPVILLEFQNRRQQQRQQKEDVIEADPNVPDAMPREGQKLMA